MPIDFPSSPTTGQVYTYLGKSWVYNGTGWDVPRALSEIGAVQTFANAAARTAAIPTPTEGIYTHLNDVDRLQFWNGSAWTDPAGMTLLNSTSFTSQTTINIDNVFNSSFDNYKIILNITSAVNTGTEIYLRMRSGGTPNTSSQYQQGILIVGAAASLNFVTTNNNTSSYWTAGYFNDTRGGSSEITLYRPFQNQATNVTLHSTGNLMVVLGGLMTVTAPYDGVSLVSSAGGLTGIAKVYGLRN